MASSSSSSSQHHHHLNNNNGVVDTNTTLDVGNQSFSSSSILPPPITTDGVTDANPWCRIAQIDDPINGVVSLMEPPPLTSAQLLQDQNNKNLDLTVSTDWMEYIERIENRTSNEGGGAGAYDTLRCDVIISPSISSSSPSCTDTNLRIWGEEFHLHRLQKSYLSLLHSQQQQQQQELSKIMTQSLNIAMEQSRSILHALLKEAQKSSSTTTSKTQIFIDNDDKSDTTFIHLFRVTLLWSTSYPSLSNNNSTDDDFSSKNLDNNGVDDGKHNISPIIVRGHASCNWKPMEINLNPTSIIASIAVHSQHHHDEGVSSTTNDDSTTIATDIDKSLPTRHDNPQSKVASWCRLRKKMENPETYKPEGVSEVLMVRKRNVVAYESSNETATAETRTQPASSQVEVLEGLSSNCFVVYKDGSLRTASDGVLYGYVRNLVLECAPKVGLTYDPTKPILLSEIDQWEEAFITSSSRLIYPISSIIIPDDGDDEINGTHSKFREIWYDKVMKKNEECGSKTSRRDESSPLEPERTSPTTQKWQQLLREVLKMGGYDI